MLYIIASQTANISQQQKNRPKKAEKPFLVQFYVGNRFPGSNKP